MSYVAYEENYCPEAKKIYVRQELLILTKTLPLTILLDHLLSLSACGLSEEKSTAGPWIEIPLKKLAQACYLDVTPTTIRRYLTELESKNWIQIRKNPTHKWARINQYRCHFEKIQTDLNKLGFDVPCYKNTPQTFQSEVIRHV